MDDPESFTDEVIADSEEENETHLRPPADAFDINPMSSVSAFTLASHEQKLNLPSSISAYTAGPSVLHDFPSAFTSLATNKDKKGKGKGKEADTSIIGTFNQLDPIPSSIADRAKTRERAQKLVTSLAPEIIELTSDDEDELNLKPSTSKAKPKPKPKPKVKLKAKEKEKEDSTEKSSASSRIDTTTAPPRPRPRPRPVVKRPKPTDEEIGSRPPPFTSTPPPSHGPDIPVATSPSRFSNSEHAMTSQLPPSDPPLSSFSAVYDGADNDLPRIETLKTRGGQENDLLSSPSSLFSEPRASKTKRKRNLLDTDAEVDELATSQNGPEFAQLGRISPSRLPPPPTFFAGSSSSSIGRDRDRERGDVPADDFPLDLDSEHDIDNPNTLSSVTVATTSAKAKKAKKKKNTDLDDYDGFLGSKMIILDEDDQDEDFNPNGDHVKKKKRPGKQTVVAKPPKSKRQKETSAGSAAKQQVEVVITKKPPKSERTKDKGKKKEKTALEQNKDNFKSREFIEDSDEDMDPAEPPHAPIVSASRPSPIVSAVRNSSTSKAASPSPLDDPLSPLSDSDFDSKMPKAGPSTNKHASGSGKKKRKSVADSDADKDDGGNREDVIIVNNAVPSKKRKIDAKQSGDSAKKGPRNVILSDDDGEGEDVDVSKPVVSDPKTKKSSKKVVHNGDKASNVQSDVQEHQSSQEENLAAIKENLAPASAKLPYSTPKPNVMKKPINSAGGDTNTPLYARYEIAPRRSSLPMAELIRRANSVPGSPFATPPASSSGLSKLKPLTGRTATAYSPYLKSSRSMLSRIAPLHPNRRTPPPPPPPPPPRKKSKKELELEEKWEEEMIESVGGVEAWAVLDDAERREMRKVKWAREMGDWDE